MFETTQKLIIAIDGYSSCGKSTLAKDIARLLGYKYMDSGAMYRAVTLIAIENKLIKGERINKKALLKKINNLQFDFRLNTIRNRYEVYLNKKCIEDKIRELRIADKVSYIARIKEIRERLVELQQKFGEGGGVVMDGRDIGTVVFPNADLKIFMIADVKIRAQRRLSELKGKNPGITIEEVLKNVKMRDYIDENREESPLRKANDAYVLDNSHLDKKQQLDKALKRIAEIVEKKKLKVVVDESAGYCFGVTKAIHKAEEQLKKTGKLYVIGDIVHNSIESKRLQHIGLKKINHQQFTKLKNTHVLIRAHGEPPDTYQTAQENNITLLDATCPIVLNIQQRVKKAYEESKTNHAQIVIYGKKGHAEVNGLVGQTDGKAIVIENLTDIKDLDFNKSIVLFSQTTKSVEGFEILVEILKEKCSKNVEVHDSICRIVSNRVPKLKKFAKEHDVIIFVSGKKSSNGKLLFEVSKNENPDSYFISNWEEIDNEWFRGKKSVGISGATSTPNWLIEKVCKAVKQ